MEQAVRVGVIGTGFGRKVHIPGLQAFAGTQVISVYNPNLDKAKQVAQTHDIPQAWDQIEAMLADPQLEAVSISTPPHLHFEMAQQALLAGKHVLLEKPIALSVNQACELYRLAQQHQRVMIPDFEFRCIPTWQHLKHLLEQNWVGSIRSVFIQWLVQSRAKPDRPWNWYAQRELGGGVLGAVGSHAFDYCRWLWGPTDRLVADLSTRVQRLSDPATGQPKPVTSDDTNLIIMRLASGVPVQIALSSITYTPRGHWVEVYGDQGTLVLGNPNLSDYIHGFTLYGSRPGETLQPLPVESKFDWEQVYTDGRQAAFMGIVSRWVQSIRHGSPVVPSMEDGIYSQLLMDLSWHSHDQQQWVRVPDLSEVLAHGGYRIDSSLERGLYSS